MAKRYNSSRFSTVHAACTNCLIQMSAELMSVLHMHVLHWLALSFFARVVHGKHSWGVFGHGNA